MKSTFQALFKKLFTCAFDMNFFFFAGMLGLYLFTSSSHTAFAAQKNENTAVQQKETAPQYNTTDPAYAAYDQGNFLMAHEEALKATQRGEAQAFTLLGILYQEGQGVPQNLQQAAKWYQQGAGKGDVDAQFALAMMLTRGQGIGRDYKLAGDFFEAASKRGHIEAQYNLGLLYAEGRGRDEDLAKAFLYMKLAAEKGSLRAQYDLATFYVAGLGAPKNIKVAAEWMQKAANGGLNEAQLEYAVMLFKGGCTEIDLVEQRKKIIDQMKSKGVDEKNIKVNEIKTTDCGIPINKSLAVKYFDSAARKNNPVAQNRLANLYLYGEGIEPNMIQAAKWHLIAKKSGVSDERLDKFLLRLSKEERETAEQEAQSWESRTILME